MHIDILFLGIGKEVGTMKKSFFLAFLVLFVIVPVFCTDISAVGYGKTRDEAKNNALNSLAMSIFPVLASNSMTTSSSASMSSFSSESSSKVFGMMTFVDFVQVELSSNERKTSNYGYMAVLRDNPSTLKMYSDLAKDAKKDIEYNYNKSQSCGTEEKKDYYYKLLTSYLDYNNCRQVLLRLGHEEMIPEIGIDKTYNILQEEYESALTEYANFINENRAKLNDQAYGTVTKLMEENQKQQEALIAQRRDALLQQQMLREAELQEQKKQFLNSTLRTPIIITGNTFKDFQSMIKELQISISEFNSICNKYESMIASENERIDTAIKEETVAIRNRAYRTGQLTIDKKPVPEALSAREQEIKGMVEEKERERKSILNYIDEIMQPVIQENYDLIFANVRQIESTRFSDSILNGGLSSSYNGYDAKELSWKITLKSEFLTGLSLKLNIAYKDVTRVTKVDFNDKNYLNNVDYYENLLSEGSFWTGNDITLSYSARLVKNGFFLTPEYMKIIIGKTEIDASDYAANQRVVLKETIRNVDSFKWLKTSTLLNPITDSKITIAASKIKQFATATKDNWTIDYRLGVTVSMLFSNDIETQVVPGFITSLDCYYGFFDGVLGFGIAPFFWVSGQNANVLGADLLVVYNPFASAIESDDFSLLYELRFGIGTKGKINTSISMNMRFTNFSFGYGVMYNNAVSEDMVAVSICLGYKII